ncbi:hypothetical protein M413DRAFT_410611 [Hebeloma cylindrosporum]|uniref:Cytochrome P450 n=1 Tax=Hebeloma cylindrosporum TaxID=76867 RepID=A0A0C2YLX8_HEBCY|nr:hypothetical protein M413DRAFT_410611 [Hebeloma cylindrosporum h7]
MSTPPLLLAIQIFAVSLSFLLIRLRAKQGPYPPGPNPKPFVGNFYDFHNVDRAMEYAKWGKRYHSDILYANYFGNHVLVLNSLEDAEELLERRSSIYSDRPDLPVLNMVGMDGNLAFMRLGHEWRIQRRICQQHFRLDAMAAQHHPVHIRKVHFLLKQLLETPEKFDHHAAMLSISIPLSVMYGYDTESLDDPLVGNVVRMFSYGVTRMFSPNGTWFNIVPWLAKIPLWLPWTDSQRHLKEVARLSGLLLNAPLEVVKQPVDEGTAQPSVLTQFFEKKDDSIEAKDRESALAKVANTIYSGASNTIILSTTSFIYLMAVNPEIQCIAQREIDRVIGENRLPTFDDRALLPYIEAIYRELLRFAPPAPLCIPHSTTEDDHYKGYFIPKGTTVYPNIWAMSRNEELYPNPHVFKPERFLNESGELKSNDRVLAYGFGRRICVGKHAASAVVWLMIVSLLASFSITKAKDEHGIDVEIFDDFEDIGVGRQKKQFQCSITPRSKAWRKLIEEA